MKIDKPRLIVATVVLVAFVAALLMLQSPAKQDAESTFFSTDSEGSAVRSVPESGNANLAAAGRRSTRVAGQTITREPTAARLRSIGTTLQASAEESLRLEVDTRYGNFLAGLRGSPERIDAIRLELIAAYGDILAFGIAVQQGEIASAEAEARTDPNYVLNQLADLLDSEELTELETYMEFEERERFQSTYAPQLELLGVELNAEHKTELLETLFTETYLLVNRDGIGNSGDLVTGFQRQLDAIENARISLRMSMAPELFNEANKFLIEQEQGLLGAQTIFSRN